MNTKTKGTFIFLLLISSRLGFSNNVFDKLNLSKQGWEISLVEEEESRAELVENALESRETTSYKNLHTLYPNKEVLFYKLTHRESPEASNCLITTKEGLIIAIITHQKCANRELTGNLLASAYKQASIRTDQAIRLKDILYRIKNVNEWMFSNEPGSHGMGFRRSLENQLKKAGYTNVDLSLPKPAENALERRSPLSRTLRASGEIAPPRLSFEEALQELLNQDFGELERSLHADGLCGASHQRNLFREETKPTRGGGGKVVNVEANEALLDACIDCDYEAIRKAFEKGARLEEVGNKGTAEGLPLVLHATAEGNSKETLELLEKNGATYNDFFRHCPYLTGQEFSPGIHIFFGTEIEDSSFGIYLLNRKFEEIKKNTGDEEKAFQVMKQFLKALRNRNNTTMLHLAAHKGDIQAAHILLSFGADPEFKNQLDISPLDLAKKKFGEESILVHLLQEKDERRRKELTVQNLKLIPLELEEDIDSLLGEFEESSEEQKKKEFSIFKQKICREISEPILLEIFNY